jgi:hypothetical protein
MREVEVVALVEPDNKRRAQVLALAGKVAAFREDCELDALPGLDAVDICSPNAFSLRLRNAGFRTTQARTSKSRSRHQSRLRAA